VKRAGDGADRADHESGSCGDDDERRTEIRKTGNEESRKEIEEPFQVFFDPSVSSFL